MNKLTVKLAVILFILLLVSIAFGCAAPALETVVFPDENLEAVIRDALDKPEGDITPAELAGLTMLNAEVLRITDLTGIEYCTNLSELDLDINQISDISPLASLTSLEMLSLTANQISDITPLVENSGLSGTISLGNNNLDLSEGSEDLKNIRILEARGVEVEY